METLSAYWLIMGELSVTGGSPHKGPVMRSFDASYCQSKQAVEQTIDLPVILDALISRDVTVMTTAWANTCSYNS